MITSVLPQALTNISGVVGDTYTHQLHCSLGIPLATLISLFSQILASFYFISSIRQSLINLT